MHPPERKSPKGSLAALLLTFAVVAPFLPQAALAQQPGAAPPAVTVARVTGAGDCFLAAHLAAELAGQPREAALRQAVQAAAAHVSGKDVP